MRAAIGAPAGLRWIGALRRFFAEAHGSGVACRPAELLQEVAHPQLASRRRWRAVNVGGASAQALLPPHNLQGATPRMDAVPALGEHTAEVLIELGYPNATGGLA